MEQAREHDTRQVWRRPRRGARERKLRTAAPRVREPSLASRRAPRATMESFQRATGILVGRGKRGTRNVACLFVVIFCAVFWEELGSLRQAARDRLFLGARRSADWKEAAGGGGHRSRWRDDGAGGVSGGSNGGRWRVMESDAPSTGQHPRLHQVPPLLDAITRVVPPLDGEDGKNGDEEAPVHYAPPPRPLPPPEATPIVPAGGDVPTDAGDGGVGREAMMMTAQEATASPRPRPTSGADAPAEASDGGTAIAAAGTTIVDPGAGGGGGGGPYRAWTVHWENDCDKPENKRGLSWANVQSVGVPNATAEDLARQEDPTAMAAVTVLTPYEAFHFELWKRYYGEAVGYDNLYVILHFHYEDPGAFSRLNLTGVTVYGVFCVYDPQKSTEIQEEATNHLLSRGYTYVVNGDVDEFFVPNKEKYPGGLVEFAQKDPGLRERDYVRTHGFSVTQMDDESAFDPALPLFAQRSRWYPVDPEYCKVMLVRRSVNSPPNTFHWSTGQHDLTKDPFPGYVEDHENCGGPNTTDADDAKLLHLKCYDKAALAHKYDGQANDMRLWTGDQGFNETFERSYHGTWCHNYMDPQQGPKEEDAVQPIDKRFTFGDNWDFRSIASVPRDGAYPPLAPSVYSPPPPLPPRVHQPNETVAPPTNNASSPETVVPSAAPIGDSVEIAIAEMLRQEWMDAKARRVKDRVAAAPGVTVPNVLHYVFGSTSNSAFSFAFFCNVVAAIMTMAPDDIIMHFEYPSNGLWWGILTRLVTMRQSKFPTDVLGATLTNPAHKTDIVRLQSLIDEGGIYFDMDVLPLRSFDDLRGNGTSFLMGAQYADEGERRHPYGLCNAVMVAEKGTRFGRYWMSKYVNFTEESGWDTYSVQLPLQLARELQEEGGGFTPDITVLRPPWTFFNPDPTFEGVAELFAGRDLSIDLTHSYTTHFWNQYSNDITRRVSPGAVVDGSDEPQTPYLNALRRVIPSHVRASLHKMTVQTEKPPEPVKFGQDHLLCKWHREQMNEIPRREHIEYSLQLPFGITCDAPQPMPVGPPPVLPVIDERPVIAPEVTPIDAASPTTTR